MYKNNTQCTVALLKQQCFQVSEKLCVDVLLTLLLTLCGLIRQKIHRGGLQGSAAQSMKKPILYAMYLLFICVLSIRFYTNSMMYMVDFSYKFHPGGVNDTVFCAGSFQPVNYQHPSRLRYVHPGIRRMRRSEPRESLHSDLCMFTH